MITLSNLLPIKRKMKISPADKESCTVILIKVDYIGKVNKMVDEGIANGKCIETNDTRHGDLKGLQGFLCRNKKIKKCYDDMCHVLNPPACFFDTAKTHMFIPSQHNPGRREKLS